MDIKLYKRGCKALVIPFTFSLIVLFTCSNNAFAQAVPSGTQLTIDFTGLSGFDFAPQNFTFSSGGHSFKIRVGIEVDQVFEMGTRISKTGTSGVTLAMSSGGQLLFDLDNDGDFGTAGDEFSLISMNVGGSLTDAFTPPGYQEMRVTPDANTAANATISSTETVLNELNIASPNGSVVTGTFSSSDYAGIKSLTFTGVSVGGGLAPTPLIDNVIIVAGVASSNTAPTASSFTASNGPYEALTHTFSTADFSYSDDDSDALDHVLIEAVPAAGTLYLDADNDDDYDAGEEVSISNQISKTNLDAGHLQYVQNGSTNTSFQFEVNDGTDDSAGNYVATLNVVGIPTVTLSQTNASLSESATGTTGTVTATLSNSYGAAVTVNLSTSGATVNSDFTISTTSITINSGGTTGNATITILDDSDLEDTETLTVAISSVTNGTENGTQSEDFTITNNDFALALKVFLEGPLSGTTMSTSLNATLPTAQPYAAASAETSSGIPATAVDWVEVELRTGTASGTKLGTNRAGILKSDGTIVDKDGNSFTMSQVNGSNLYMVVHHRNHLSVMTANAVTPSSGTYTFDFTTAQANNFNNGSDGAIQVGSVFAMISGDTDDDGDVDATDLGTWQAQNGLTFSYSSNGKTDLNLDGTINAVDRNDFQQKNSTKTSQVPTT